MAHASRYFSPVGTFGHKWYPEDLAGMVGLPHVGSIFYLDPLGGNDNNSGKDLGNAFATLTAAYAALTDNHHDVVIIAPTAKGTGEPYATTEIAAITWSKSLCHVVGNVGPTPFSSRARVATATAGLSPFITISGQGNSFHNMQFYSNATTNYIDVRVSGNRNFFENVHFAGPANATAATNAGAGALELYGAQENYFRNCAIGMDTVTRTGANANLKITLGADTVARNVFDDCIFPMLAGSNAPLFIKQADVNGMDRFNLFRNPVFVNAIGSTATTTTDAIAINATPGGVLILQSPVKVGTTGWADNLTNVYIIGSSSAATYADGIGFAVNPSA
jgi:hypothetical protein